MMPTPFPTLLLVGGPYNGDRRPIIDGHIPERIERLQAPGGPIQVYEHRRTADGDQFVWVGSRAIRGAVVTA